MYSKQKIFKKLKKADKPTTEKKHHGTVLQHKENFYQQLAHKYNATYCTRRTKYHHYRIIVKDKEEEEEEEEVFCVLV
jgi:predicted nucleotidyltransferase